MTTLYYSAVYFRYAQELDRLIAFTAVRAPLQAELKRKLDGVAYAFARTGTVQADKGLWGVVQDNMGKT